jgi:F-type H+-transporting ATPase subunit a
MTALHISISAETVFHIGGFAVTNSMILSVVGTAVILGIAALLGSAVQHPTKSNRKVRALAEMIVESVNTLIEGIAGKPKTALFAPIFLSFFMFVLLNNWLGLLPGVGTIGFNENEEEKVVVLPQRKPLFAHIIRPVQATSAKIAEEIVGEPVEIEGTAATEEKAEIESKSEEEHTVFVPFFRAATADINTTLALAIISVFLTQYFGVKFQGMGYFKKFFDFSSPIAVFVGLLELVSELGKILSFAFRLFGNIFAGEVLLTVMLGLTKLVVPMPFYAMELFVGGIQALVFALLSLVFFNMATMGHHDE